MSKTSIFVQIDQFEQSLYVFEPLFCVLAVILPFALFTKIESNIYWYEIIHLNFCKMKNKKQIFRLLIITKQQLLLFEIGRAHV